MGSRTMGSLQGRVRDSPNANTGSNRPMDQWLPGAEAGGLEREGERAHGCKIFWGVYGDGCTTLENMLKPLNCSTISIGKLCGMWIICLCVCVFFF